MDMLRVDFLGPTTTRFPETTTGNTFSNSIHNSIQRLLPHIPVNLLFGANPLNAFSQHPSHEPSDSHGPSTVRFSVGSVVPTHHFPITTQLGSGTYLLQALEQVISYVNVLHSN